jgi:hypothetical protein
LALDGAGTPHISYYDHSGRALMYASRPAAAWLIEPVDRRAEVGYYSSLALDASGRAHIGYYDATYQHLKYAYQGSAQRSRNWGVWQLETVDTQREVGMRASLALDSEGFPHIAYKYQDTSGSGEAVRYAFKDAAGWHIDTASSGYVDFLSLALDKNDQPHIAHQGSICTYTYRDASGWETEYVAFLWASADVSIAVDENLSAHVACPDPWGGDVLQYAYRDASGWNVEIVDNGGFSSVSLALDEEGYPHLCYSGYFDLKYAYKDALGWHIEIVDAEGGKSISLALDQYENPHISYINGRDEHFKYAYRDTDGWHVQILGTGLGSGGTSLALDADGHPHISYYDSATSDLKYAFYYETEHAIYLPLVTRD